MFDRVHTLSAVVLFVVFLNCVFCKRAETIADQRDGLTCCEDHCSHITSKVSNPLGIAIINSCRRGCRLFRICELITSNLTAANHDCKMACIESYQGKDNKNQVSCINGCNAALPYAQAHHSKNDDRDLFGDLDAMMNSMMDSASRQFSMMFPFMSSSHAIRTQVIQVFDGSNHGVIIVESVEPEFSPGENKAALSFESPASKKMMGGDHLRQNFQNNVDRLDKVDLSKPNGYFNGMKYRAQNWWSNFTRKAGLPEIVLFLFWISTSLLLVMTCFVQFPPRSSKQLSVNGDLAFITDSKGKLPSYMQAYPCPENGEKSPYFIASVVQAGEKKMPMIDKA